MDLWQSRKSAWGLLNKNMGSCCNCFWNKGPFANWVWKIPHWGLGHWPWPGVFFQTHSKNGPYLYKQINTVICVSFLKVNPGPVFKIVLLCSQGRKSIVHDSEPEHGRTREAGAIWKHATSIKVWNLMLFKTYNEPLFERFLKSACRQNSLKLTFEKQLAFQHMFCDVSCFW